MLDPANYETGNDILRAIRAASNQNMVCRLLLLNPEQTVSTAFLGARAGLVIGSRLAVEEGLAGALGKHEFTYGIVNRAWRGALMGEGQGSWGTQAHEMVEGNDGQLDGTIERICDECASNEKGAATVSIIQQLEAQVNAGAGCRVPPDLTLQRR